MTEPQVPDGFTPIPHRVYCDRASLRAALGEPAGQDDRLDEALVLASRAVDHLLGVNAEDAQAPIADTPVEFPLVLDVVAVDPRVRAATRQVAIRGYRSPELVFGVIGGMGDLGMRVRAHMPEVEWQLRGLRQDWPVG